MKSLKRMTSSIVASFDWMVSQVENHESLVNSAIKEVQESGAKARVQLKRVQQDGKNMRKRLSELRDADEKWRERAITIADIDEKRALECLRRRKRVQKEITDLEVQEREHAKLEKQLSEDLTLIDDRLIALRQQRNLLRTRQSRAEALTALKENDSHIISEIDDIFDRWETKVAEYEIQANCNSKSYDDFETEFVSTEEEAELKEMLAMLKDDAADAVKQLQEAVD